MGISEGDVEVFAGKRHEPFPSEVFIGCCALCGADLGHWWHEPVAIEEVPK